METNNKLHSGLNNFLGQEELNNDSNKTNNKKTLKKVDGLIERVDITKKMYITEDNRQLLND